MNRNDPAPPSSDRTIAARAAEWVMRHDRGLSPDEQDGYLQWLASDPRHAGAMATQRAAWEAFDRLAGLQSAVEAAPDPDLLVSGATARPATGRARVLLWLAVAVPLAAAIVMLFWMRQNSDAIALAATVDATAAAARLAPIEERALADGTVVRLNRGARIAVEFSDRERRVRLQRGEAAFEVVKDAARPFVVMTQGVVIRAVGTAFNVRLGDQAVDVIVIEGRVTVASGLARPGTATPVVDAGQRAVVSLAPAVGLATVSELAGEELARRLAWQPRVLTFTDESIGTILNEFNRHNPVSLRIADPALQELRLSARFRSDNVQGFLRLLESSFRVHAQFQTGGEIILRSAP